MNFLFAILILLDMFSAEGRSGKTKYSFTYTYLDGENSTFKFNTDGKENHYSLNLRNDALAYQWIPVSFAFDLQQDVLTIRIGDNEKKITSLGLKDTFVRTSSSDVMIIFWICPLLPSAI